jgi:hypothetical protein
VVTTTDLEVFVEYGFVDLTGDTELADLHLSRQGQRNGICGAKVAGHLSMITGTHTGSIAFRVEMHDSPPAVEALWEEIVEVSVELPAGSMQLATFDDWHDLPVMAPGWHRARYCALAMDKGRDADPPEGLAEDRYLLVLWPAPFAPEVVVRQTSATARYWASVADGTEKEYVARARDEEWSTEGIDPQMWGGELPTQELLKAGNYAPAMAMIDRPLADAVAALSEDGHRAVTTWVCARMAPQARAVAGIDWHALAQTVACVPPVAPPFDDRTSVDGLMFGLDQDGFPDLPEPPIEKAVLAAWAILDPLTFPEDRPVEDAMRALVNGYDADAAPEAFLDGARDLVITLS